jgi:hypothetical protein
MFVTVQVHVDRHKKGVVNTRSVSLVYYDNNYYVEKSLGKFKFEKTGVVVDGYCGNSKAYISKGVNNGDILVGQGKSFMFLGQ